MALNFPYLYEGALLKNSGTFQRLIYLLSILKENTENCIIWRTNPIKISSFSKFSLLYNILNCKPHLYILSKKI